MTKPVCAVVGIGPKNGASFARRFAADGYAVALLSRKIDGGLKTHNAHADVNAPTNLDPDDIATTAYFLSQQPRSVWSFEVDMRPSQENW